MGLACPDEYVCDCNCSICAGVRSLDDLSGCRPSIPTDTHCYTQNGAIWIYPKDDDYVFSPSSEAHLVKYTFTDPSPRQNALFSCKTCSTMIYEKRMESDHIGLNVRLLEGLGKDWDWEKVVTKENSLADEPRYKLV
jgi:hypothetical protein